MVEKGFSFFLSLFLFTIFAFFAIQTQKMQSISIWYTVILDMCSAVCLDRVAE